MRAANHRRSLSIFTSMMLLPVILLSACSGNGNKAADASAGNGGNENAAAAVQTNNEPAAAEEPAASNSEPAAEEAAEPKLDMTMFYGDSGLSFPQGVDPSDNPWIDIVEQAANVDLKVDVPSSADFATKFSLLLASGKLPDIVHTWLPGEADKAAAQGAFIDLKAYYDKSPIIQKYITPEMMEYAKAPDGRYYRIPMAWNKAPQGSGLIARYDLIQKYNDGKWPESVDEWVALMRKIHQAEPKKAVLTNVNWGDPALYSGGVVFYNMYGATPYGTRVQEGNVIPNFILPEYREATVLMKQLYDEGILDKEFATMDEAKAAQKAYNGNVLLTYDTADQLVPGAQANKQGGVNPVTKDWMTMFAPPLKTYPSVLKDPKYAQPYKGYPIIDHGLYISSSTKDPDRAWKVIEAFASDDLYNAIFWGKEGDTYTTTDGKRVINADKLSSPDRYWSLHLAFIFGFASGQDVKKALAEQILGPDYSAKVYDSLQMVAEEAEKNGFAGFPGMALSEEATNKLGEVNAFISQATFEAIMGKISMEQFDKKVEQFKEKYGFIYEEETKYMNEHKAELLAKGDLQVNW
ncbi:extracellular solute-binding protein [Paenibacillus silvisoli]|uniref:extracellular solute-binding protein n=1 Tax=Paenibacillus silvisoli TaxID=3110539 RepID=UPI00280565DE|nr:extracellular solute-binding protein [Paenibacillus silvisoli]